MATVTKIIKFLRETLPHGEYRLMDYDYPVVSQEELVGYVLGELMSEGRVSVSAHHLAKSEDIDIVLDSYDGMVLKVLKHTIALVDTEYGFGDYKYETISTLDLSSDE